MGLFNVNLEETPTVKGLIRTALNNLELYEPYCTNYKGEGRYKDETGQTPPDYLVKDFAMKYLRHALEILESVEE